MATEDDCGRWQEMPPTKEADYQPTAEQIAAALRRHQTPDDVLEAFPHAVFMPWDEPPVGTRIRTDMSKEARRGVVVGRYDGWVAHPHVYDVSRVCSTARCACPSVPHAFFGYWIIQPDGGGPQELHYPPYLQLETPRVS